MELWAPVPGLEDRYAISSEGRLKRTAKGKKTYPGKLLNPSPTKAGYLKATLGVGRNRKGYYLHHLVAQCFLPPPQSAVHRYVAHKNGNCQDNRAENLYWATPSENSYDQFLHGRVCGESHPDRKRISDSDVRRIRADSRPLAAIAAEFNVTPSAIGRIRRGLTYKHVQVSAEDVGATKKLRKFTVEQVRSIRKSHAPNSVVARQYEVSANTIRDIRSGKFYRWVDETHDGE